ncbi:MAG: sugar nucleotide-binding protein [bacterium]|nr:sugar nucleotide-binding protein [bacterium]
MTEKIPLLITGSSGLIGSKFTQVFADKYEFQTLDISDPVRPIDITDKSAVFSFFENSTAQTCVHLAAFTDVSAAWEQRGDKNGLAYKINVTGTETLSQAASKFDKHLILISTAYVFDGKKDTLYTENDKPNPIEWYGQTKAYSEDIVTASDHLWSILRIDQPFRSDPFTKLDIAHKFAQKITEGSAKLFDNHYFGPTFIDDFVRVIDFMIQSKTTGIYHATSGEKWSDYAFGLALQEVLKLPGKIEKSDLVAYQQNQVRPYQTNTALSIEKLKQVLPFDQLPIVEAMRLLQL